MCNYVVDFCLYAAVLKMERCADLGSCILRYLWWYTGCVRIFTCQSVPFFDTYSDIPSLPVFRKYATLHSHNPRTGRPRPLPSPARILSFFLSAGSVSQREMDIGSGCCGGGVITTWAAGEGVIAAGSAV